MALRVPLPLFCLVHPLLQEAPDGQLAVSANSVEASWGSLVKAFHCWILKLLYQQSSESQGLESNKKFSDSFGAIVSDTITPLSPLVAHSIASVYGTKPHLLYSVVV